VLYLTDKDRKCPPGHKKCPTSSQCIRIHKFCDDVKDCDDGSDEADYVCSEYFESN